MQRASGLLPSRAADNLFWVGRYVERAEATLRLVRAIINRVAEADDAAAPVIASIGSLLAAWNAIPSDTHAAPATFIARAVLTRGDLEGALPRLVGAARSAASVIRDRFSPDAWRAINDLANMIAAPLAIGPTESAIAERVEAALRIIAALSGLAQENMTQLAGWRFLELGRRIERALLTCRLTRAFAQPGAADGGLDVLLELADSQISYRQRYVMIAALAPVDRSRHARSEQSALGGVSARSHRDPSRARCRSAAPAAGCRRCSRSPPRSPRGCAPPKPPPSTTR